MIGKKFKPGPNDKTRTQLKREAKPPAEQPKQAWMDTYLKKEIHKMEFKDRVDKAIKEYNEKFPHSLAKWLIMSRSSAVRLFELSEKFKSRFEAKEYVRQHLSSLEYDGLLIVLSPRVKWEVFVTDDAESMLENMPPIPDSPPGPQMPSGKDSELDALIARAEADGKIPHGPGPTGSAPPTAGPPNTESAVQSPPPQVENSTPGPSAQPPASEG